LEPEFEQAQKQVGVGEIADKDVSNDSLREPVSNRLQSDHSLQGSKRFLHQILIKEPHQLILGQRTGGENTGVTIEFLSSV
jgi:hypothetical protein